MLLKMPDAEVSYYADLFTPAESDHLLNALQHHIDWRQDEIKMYGKVIPLPRLTAWYGDPGKSYTYSGITMEALAWTDELLTIKQRIEPIAGIKFNSVLLNYYRSGNDSMSWHADDEPESGRWGAGREKRGEPLREEKLERGLHRAVGRAERFRLP